MKKLRLIIEHINNTGTYKSAFLEEFNAENERYTERMISIDGGKGDRNGGIGVTIQTNLIKVFRWNILAMSWMTKNYMIVLEIENSITYGIINSFTKTKKNLVFVDRQ